ncbi:MAG: hypothetical protein ABIR26_12105, partial [Ramlibacter sp.]
LAANADKMDADDSTAIPQATAEAPRKSFGGVRPPQDGNAESTGAPDAARPGKDINAPGFIKDRDPRP